MIIRISLVAVFTVLLAAGCMKKEGAADSGANAKADSMKAAYTALSAAWDAGKADELDKYISANPIEHNPEPGQEPGLAGLKKIVLAMKVGFPDEHSTIDDMRVDGDILVVRSKMSGTNSGPMMGMPATNKKISNVMGVDWVRWQDGKFVEHWGLYDTRAMMQQLGLMPPPGAPPAGDGKMEDKKK